MDLENIMLSETHRHYRTNTVWSHLHEVPRTFRLVETEGGGWLPGAEGRRELFNRYEFQFHKRWSWEMRGGDGCATLWIYLALLSCTFKIVNFILCIWYCNKKVPSNEEIPTKMYLASLINKVSWLPNYDSHSPISWHVFPYCSVTLPLDLLNAKFCFPSHCVIWCVKCNLMQRSQRLSSLLSCVTSASSLPTGNGRLLVPLFCFQFSYKSQHQHVLVINQLCVVKQNAIWGHKKSMVLLFVRTWGVHRSQPMG